MHHLAPHSSSPLRILFLLGSPNLSSDVPHLTERLALAERIQAAGHQVTILLPRGPGLARATESTLEVYSHGPVGARYFPGWASRRTQAEVAAGREALSILLRRETFDLVHVFGLAAAEAIAAPELAGLDLPWVVHVEAEDIPSAAALGEGERVVLRQAVGVTTANLQAQAQVREAVGRSSVVLPYGMVTDGAEPIPASAERSMAFIRVLGHHRAQLQQAIRLIAQFQAESGLVAQLEAPGFTAAEVKAMATKFQAEVRFHSQLSPALAQTLLRHAAFTWQFNGEADHDQIERTLLEGMEAGACILATRHRLATGLIRHMETGLLVDATDGRALMTTARFLLELPAQRRSLAQRAQQFARWYLHPARLADEAIAAYRYYTGAVASAA